MHASKLEILLIVLCSLLSVLAIEEKNNTALVLSDKSSLRQSKFFGIGIVRFENSLCVSDGLWGTCYRRSQCTSINGVGSGSCANGIGVCCISQISCGNITQYNNTYFVNTNFPGTYSGGGSCSITIRRCDSDICQLRIDFLSFTLAQPDGNGNCIYDALYVTGGASNVPIICGDNSGQHIYVNFNGDNDITLRIDTTSTVALARSWNLKIAQIGCACPTRAPAGCLMYYTALTGTVRSFNYGTTVSGALVVNANNQTRPGTRELANLNYGVCIQMQPGYCSIQWSQSGSADTSFTVSGDTITTSVIAGLPSDSVIGENCTTDFVVIPNPIYAANNTAVPGDRFCGNQFPTVYTGSKPFVLTVVTNDNDMDDVGNRGFELNYAQQACSISRFGTVATG